MASASALNTVSNLEGIDGIDFGPAWLAVSAGERGQVRPDPRKPEREVQARRVCWGWRGGQAGGSLRRVGETMVGSGSKESLSQKPAAGPACLFPPC